MNKTTRSLLAAVMFGSGVAAIAAEVPPPPKLEPIEEPRQPAKAPVAGASMPEARPDSEVTVSRRGQDRVEEFRLKGRLYMIRVYPAVGLPYSLVDDKGDGVFNRHDGRDGPGAGVKNAQWKVLSW